MLYLATAALAFSAPTLPSGSRVSSSVVMTAGEPMLARRAMFGAAAAAIATAGPMAAFADGASSPAVLAKSRARCPADLGDRGPDGHAEVCALPAPQVSTNQLPNIRASTMQPARPAEASTKQPQRTRLAAKRGASAVCKLQFVPQSSQSHSYVRRKRSRVLHAAAC